MGYCLSSNGLKLVDLSPMILKASSIAPFYKLILLDSRRILFRCITEYKECYRQAECLDLELPSWRLKYDEQRDYL
jgi:hypothetical protein